MNKGFLYARSCPITEQISVVVPTVGEILEDEDKYYSLAAIVTATPSDFMVQLDDVGIDFSSISPFELFLMLFAQLKDLDTQLIFGSLDLSQFKPITNPKNHTVVLQDSKNGIVIDRGIHRQICATLRKVNHWEENNRKPGNDEAKKYMIERARIKQRRAAHRPRKSQLEDLIIALVNTEQFKYGYEEALGLTIYQFMASVNQIVRKINYDNTMIGCYAGTIKVGDLSQDQLNWLSIK